MLTVAQLLALWKQRERDAGPKRARDRESLEYFEGNVAVPLPEMDTITRTAVANLMLSGMTALSQRVASTRPMCDFAMDGTSRAAQKRQRAKRRAMTGMWDENRLHLQDRQRARWLFAYATSPVVVRPCYLNGQWSVRWEPRSALSAYPAPTPTHLDMSPSDTIFATTLAASKIEAAWPDARDRVRALRGYRADQPRDDTLTLVEYVGPDAYVCAAVGVRDDTTSGFGLSDDVQAVNGRDWCVELERVENRVGRSMAVVLNNISLETPRSQFEGMKGLYDWKATLMAKYYRAVANDVDPATWFVENENGGGAIVTVADGPSGTVGHVRGGQLEVLQHTPNAHAATIIDRLEREGRLEGGVSADINGESGTNIRTARRGSELLAAVVDFPIQEAQELLAESRRIEDNLAIDIALAYFPDMSRSWGGFTFTPRDTFKGSRDDWHTVAYSLAGADANGQVIRIGQLVGTGLMSEATGRASIPDIDDPEFEHDQVIAEQIEKGIMADFMQPSAPGAPLDVVAKSRVADLVQSDRLELAQAIIKVHEEMQQAQSPAVEPAPPGAPETMPGLGGPAQQAGAAAPAGPDLGRLSQLLAQLRTPQQFQTAGEAAAGVQAAV